MYLLWVASTCMSCARALARSILDLTSRIFSFHLLPSFIQVPFISLRCRPQSVRNQSSFPLAASGLNTSRKRAAQGSRLSTPTSAARPPEHYTHFPEGIHYPQKALVAHRLRILGVRLRHRASTLEPHEPVHQRARKRFHQVPVPRRRQDLVSIRNRTHWCMDPAPSVWSVRVSSGIALMHPK